MTKKVYFATVAIVSTGQNWLAARARLSHRRGSGAARLRENDRNADVSNAHDLRKMGLSPSYALVDDEAHRQRVSSMHAGRVHLDEGTVFAAIGSRKSADITFIMGDVDLKTTGLAYFAASFSH